MCWGSFLIWTRGVWSEWRRLFEHRPELEWGRLFLRTQAEWYSQRPPPSVFVTVFIVRGIPSNFLTVLRRQWRRWRRWQWQFQSLPNKCNLKVSVTSSLLRTIHFNFLRFWGVGDNLNFFSNTAICRNKSVPEMIAYYLPWLAGPTGF